MAKICVAWSGCISTVRMKSLVLTGPGESHNVVFFFFFSFFFHIFLFHSYVFYSLSFCASDDGLWYEFVCICVMCTAHIHRRIITEIWYSEKFSHFKRKWWWCACDEFSFSNLNVLLCVKRTNGETPTGTGTTK